MDAEGEAILGELAGATIEPDAVITESGIAVLVARARAWVAARDSNPCRWCGGGLNRRIDGKPCHACGLEK